MNFFYPLPNQPGTVSRRLRRLPAVRARRPRTATAPTSASTTRLSKQRLALPARQLPAPRPAGRHLRGRATRSPTCRILKRALNTASVVGGLDEDLLPHRRERVPRRLQLRQVRAREHLHRRRTSTPQLGLESAPSLDAPTAAASPRSSSPPGANRPGNITDQGRNVDRTLSQNAFSVSDNVSWIMGGHSLKAGGLFTRNSATDGFGLGVNFRGRYRFNGAADRQRLHRLPARAAPRRRRPGQQPRPAGGLLATTSRSSSRTTGGSTAA